ncbi:hypothetical protein [Limnohabitans sp. 63ED37-2]|uniref:hypothetical protein n=1 Tax=Limnohabitans sp. 63ED37-2 TaxID=1678128 RepID=UPI0007068CBA|nr:hypothetical protein [Limnohabitans sp. 63ED37-2]ALK87677.1 hypothetical protein L63ED372_00450 [Limnohabitans sp. 63ED37-2]
MSDDPRCCGTGTCIINAEGLCWCGQRWDGEKMCFMSEPKDGRSAGQGQADQVAVHVPPDTAQ